MNTPVSISRFQQQTVLLRIGLLGTAIVLFTRAFDLWLSGHSSLYPLSLVLSFLALGFGACLSILALCRELRTYFAWFVLIGLVSAFLVSGYIQWRNDHPLIAPHTDNEMIAEYAVQVLRRGMNPYAWDFSDFRRAFHVLHGYTAFLDGSMQRRVTYPALPTLVLSALDLIRLGDAKLVSAAAHLLLLITLFINSPRPFRPVILLPLFVFREFTLYPLGGVQDVFWCVLLVMMILSWNRPIWRAVLFGLACAYRQQPWLLAPFLVILLWQEGGAFRERLLRVGDFSATATAVFLIINLPFVIWDPVAWGFGTLEPSFASFNVWSQGIAAFTQFGVLPWPKMFYTGLQISFYLSALILYWRHPRSVGYAIWIVPAFVFWLYYRALSNYWIYWIPPLLLILARSYEPQSTLEKAPRSQQKSWKLTTGFVGGIAGINAVLALVLLIQPDPVAADYTLPFLTSGTSDDPMTSRIEIELTNYSSRTMRPRFSSQQDQPYPWLIESGPEALYPGQSGTYVTRATYPGVSFPVSEGAQIVVTDAGDDYSLREVLDIPADITFQDADLILNPRYQYWAEVSQLPVGWALRASPEGTTATHLETVGGRDALVLRLDTPGTSGSARLSQQITFPDAFDIWVYPTNDVSAPEQGIGYGLEFDDGINRLWLLFGNVERQGFLGEHWAYVSVQAPLDAWSLQHVALVELYARLDWPLPPLTRRVRNDLSLQARQTELSLLHLTDGSAESMSVFGPIEQPPVRRPGSTNFLEQALENPSDYYIGLGNEHTSQRNYQLAIEAYQTALFYQQDNAEAHYGLSMAYSGLGEQDRAQAALDESLNHGYLKPASSMAMDYFDLAESLFWQDDWDGAISAYRSAIALGLEKPFMAYKGLGWAYSSLGALEDARQNFELAIQAIVHPEQNAHHLADALVGLGWVTLSLDGCEKAIPLFERAEDLVPGLIAVQEAYDACNQTP